KRIRRLALGKLEPADCPRRRLLLDELVDRAEGRLIPTRDKLRSDAENVDRRTGREKIPNLVLVQIPARDNLNVLSPRRIKPPSPLLAQPPQSPAIQSNGLQRRAACQRFLDTLHGVIGVHQHGGGSREQVAELSEGLSLVPPRHDPRMRLGAERRNIEQAG